jgi:hypothetical protein
VVIVIDPVIALGVIVPEGLVVDNVNAYFGIESNVIAEIVHVESVAPRTSLTGLMSSCVRIIVSADCVQHISPIFVYDRPMDDVSR